MSLDARSFLPYGTQWIDDNDIEAVAKVLKGDWLTCGPAITQFEKELAASCDARYAVACANGTAALHLVQLALGTKPGDRVITTPNTFLATANAVRYVGADVVFADIRPDTANIDPEQVAALLHGDVARTIKGIIPVHFGGHPADMAALHEQARKHGCWIVEDACHALGAEYNDHEGVVRVGSCKHSLMTVFSFHPVKHIAMGEGGAITTNDEKLYQRLLQLRSHGMVHLNNPDMPWYYEMREVGYNYRLTDMQAALGSSQLKKLGRFVARRKEIAAQYRKAFSGMEPLLRPLDEAAGNSSSYHLFPVLIQFEKAGMTRGTFMKRLAAERIGSQVHYIPVCLQPYYSGLYGHKAGDFPATDRYYSQTLSLPMFPKLTNGDVERIIGVISRILHSDR